jgi:hypothetical protein
MYRSVRGSTLRVSMPLSDFCDPILVRIYFGEYKQAKYVAVSKRRLQPLLIRHKNAAVLFGCIILYMFPCGFTDPILHAKPAYIHGQKIEDLPKLLSRISWI